MAESTVTNIEEQPESEKKKKSKWRVFVGHIVRAMMWVLFITYRRGFLHAFSPTTSGIYAYRWYAFLGVPAVYVLIRTVTKREFLKAFFETIGFYIRYFIFPLTILWQLWKLLKWLFRQLSKLTKLSRRAEIQLSALILGAITVRIILVANQPWLLYCCMSLLGFCLLVLWKSIFDWTTNPFRTFGRLSTLVEKIWSGMSKKLYGKQGGNSSEQKTRKSSFQMLWMAGRSFLWIDERLSLWLDKRFLKTRLLTWFLIFYLVALALTIFGFAIEYETIRRINPLSFGGSIDTFADSLYYTALTSFTMSFGKTVPMFALAKVLTFANIATMMFFFVILILIFTTVTEEAARHTLKRLKDSFSKKIDETKKISDKVFHIDGNILLKVKSLGQLPDLPQDS